MFQVETDYTTFVPTCMVTQLHIFFMDILNVEQLTYITMTTLGKPLV